MAALVGQLRAAAGSQPIAVHCFAGCGRTGTLLAVMALSAALAAYGPRSEGSEGLEALEVGKLTQFLVSDHYAFCFLLCVSGLRLLLRLLLQSNSDNGVFLLRLLGAPAAARAARRPGGDRAAVAGARQHASGP